MDDYDAKLKVATEAFDYVMRRIEELGPTTMLHIEEKVQPTSREDLWGSADIILVLPDFSYAEVIDLKGGDGIPVSADSDQLKIYALGVLHDIIGLDFDRVMNAVIQATIVQPRYPIDGETVRSVTYTGQELCDWRDAVLIPACEAADNCADDPTSALSPGESQCRFCEAKGSCPGLADKSLHLAMSVFQDQTDHTLGELVSADPTTLPIEKVVEIVENMPMITGWLKAVEKHAHKMLMDHEVVPGYKLVTTGQRNKWQQPDDEVLHLLTNGAHSIDRALLTKESVLTAPQALKLKGLDGTQRERLQSLIGKSAGNFKMVPVTDERPDAFPAPRFQDVSFLD